MSSRTNSSSRTMAPSPIPQPDDERLDPSLRARTPPPHVLLGGINNSSGKGGPGAGKEEASQSQDGPPAEQQQEYEVPITRTASNSTSGRPPAPIPTGTAAHTGNRPHLHTYETINSLNTTQTDQSLSSQQQPQTQITVTFGTPSQSLKKRAATAGTPNTAVTAASSAAGSAITSNSNSSHYGTEEEAQVRSSGGDINGAAAHASEAESRSSRRSKPPSLPETPPATPSHQAEHDDALVGAAVASSAGADRPRGSLSISVPNLPRKDGAKPTSTIGSKEDGIESSKVSTSGGGGGGARWVDAETHARNSTSMASAAASAAANTDADASSSATNADASQPTAPTTGGRGKSTALTTTAAPSSTCWGSNLLRFATSASGGLLSPKIQPAFVDNGDDGDGDDGGDCPSDEEGRQNGTGNGKYAGVYEDDEEMKMEGAWSTRNDINGGGLDGSGGASASAGMGPNTTDGPASDGGGNDDNHKASSRPTDKAAAAPPAAAAAAAAAIGGSSTSIVGGGKVDDEYVELNASFEQKQDQKKRQQQQQGSASGQAESFVQTIYENALDVCNGCSGGVGADGSALGGIGALPAGASGELSETAQELYAAVNTSFDTLATGLQSMMNLGSTSGDAGFAAKDDYDDANEGRGHGGSTEDAGKHVDEAAVASSASDYPVQQQRPFPMQAQEAQHQQEFIAPPSYYSERDRLIEEAAHYEASGDHAAALACLERCLPQNQARNGPHDLSLPALGAASGGQGSGQEYLRYTASTSTNEAEILHKMGIIYWKGGSYDASLGRLLDGLAIYRRTLKISPLATRADKAESVGNAGVRLINQDADAMADILNSIGRVYFSRGDYAQAMRYYNESLAIQTDVYADAFAAMSRSTSPAEDVASLSSGQSGNPGANILHASHSAHSLANNIGTADSSLNGPSSPPPPPLSPESPPTSPTTSVASRKRRKAAIMHPGVARTTICMGMVHEAQGRYSRAMRFYKDGLRAQRSALGSDHVDVAATLNAMGSLYEKTGDIQLSMKCFEEALSIYRCRLGDDHTDTAVTLNNVGQVQFQLKEYDRAMESYSEALRIMKKNLGEEHRNVAATMHNIGLVYSARGQYSDALKIYRTVLNSQRAALGDTHFDVAVTLDSVASAYEGQERYEKAGKFYGKALRVRRAALGRDHLFVGLTLDRIGTFHLNIDRNYSEAVRRFDEAKAVYETNSLDKSDPRVKEVLSKLEMALKLDAEARAAVDF